MASKLPSSSSDSYSNHIKTGVSPSPDVNQPSGPAEDYTSGMSDDSPGNLYNDLPANPTASHTADTDTVGHYVPLP